MELNENIINFDKKEENNISKKTKKKANRIHLELLSFIQNEINSSKSKVSKKKFIINNCIINDEQKSKDDYCSDDDEEQEDNSSDISVEQETII